MLSRQLNWGALRGLSAALIAISALAGGPAYAEGPFPEHSVVQAPDSTLYVYEGGMLHAIEAVLPTEEELATVPQGDPVTTGVTILPPPPPPCGPLGVRVTVLEQQRPFQGAFPPRAGLEFVRLRLRIENCRDATLLTLAYESALMVRDANGSTRDWQSGGNTPPVPEPLTGTNVPPGEMTEGNAIISVPVGVPLKTVIWVVDQASRAAVEAAIP